MYEQDLKSNAPPMKTQEYRQDGIVNSDKLGRREDGRSGPRRCSTAKPLKGEATCKFSITIAWDEFGFYLKQNVGNPYHTGHPKFANQDLATPNGFLSTEDQEVIIHVHNACGGAAIGRNYILTKFGKFVPSVAIRSLQNEATLPQPEEGDNRKLPANDIEGLLRYFETEEDISFQVLWDVPAGSTNKTSNETQPLVDGSEDDGSGGHMLLSTTFDKDAAGNVTERETDHSTEPAMDELGREVSAAREDESIFCQDKIFLCIAWTNKEELRLFQKFPSLVYCDATSDTNKNKNHLITFSGRTTNGKQFIFLRVWVHNQKRVTFKWIFQAVLKSFLPSGTHEMVQLVLVDGDPQQMSEVRLALQQYLTSAMFTNCGFHLVTIGFKRAGIPKPDRDAMKTQYDALVSVLLHWMYSFMRPGYCENGDKYLISKTLLFHWLKSKDVATVLGVEGPANAPTGPHEGTNFGIKSHAARVMPSHTMVKAGKSLIFQSKLKVKEIRHEATRSMLNTPLWSGSATSKHVVKIAESILLQIAERVSLYQARRVAQGEWQVTHAPHGSQLPPGTNGTKKVPKFTRIRTVKLVNCHLECSCCHYESVGLPCVHQGAVIASHSKSEPWTGFGHHDVDLAWWTHLRMVNGHDSR
ncbi:unnamed protein product [Cylindrotheca closterium]|uniref:SWIM-type domain-containing protein n=1 Tax=Cylindrotheca closterium TaxID=2856 RepID=A0AAD2FNM5_9STRA|nr:unnamed protein product [Cylindrotheca closterium]